MKWLFKLLFRFIFGIFLFSIVWVLAYKFINPPLTFTMIGNSFDNIKGDGPVIWQQDWKSLDEISSQYIKAVIASEDQKFLDHNGFDFEAIKKAYEYNKKNTKNKIKGGSTISQQTAKNAFLWQDRSMVRKGLEAYFTFLIEMIWGKERIMEVYLNIAEMGNGIYGVGAASKVYFKKEAKNVNKNEAALVVAILPSPKKLSVTNPSAYTRKRQNWIMNQMKYISWSNKQK
ncbi:MAG: monofunctional biosynthetic peptidoglycan transglycosylase [Chitinophagales bacterium]|nr:monofunctional biosynthetic peptidoglycan transglycosylase [Chitinophagales bacterium]